MVGTVTSSYCRHNKTRDVSIFLSEMSFVHILRNQKKNLIEKVLETHLRKKNLDTYVYFPYEGSNNNYVYTYENSKAFFSTK